MEIGGDHWERHRWQLVHVSHDDGNLVVDAVELLDGDEGGRPVQLVTLAFRPPDELGADDDQSIGDRLAAWVHRDDGLCDAYHRTDLPYGCLAMFQRRDAVIVATDESGGTWR